MNKDVSADGLRGIAAFSVILCHFLISFSPSGFKFLYPGTSAANAGWSRLDSVISMPILSILWSGHFAVCVFFVLSGYVLTKSFLQSGDITVLKLRAARRYVRLSVPIMGSVILSYVLLTLGLKSSDSAAMLSGSSWLSSFWNFNSSLDVALKEGVYGAIFSGASLYTPPLWTMKIEFIGSMIVFAYAALALQGRQALISYAIWSVALFFFFPGEWMFYQAFIIGSHIGGVNKSDNKFLIYGSLVLGVILGAFDFSSYYGWTNFLQMEDQHRKNLFCVIGGVLVVYAVRSGALKYVLESRAAQYLGKISYSLYLVHFPILLTLSSWLYVTMSANGVHYYAALIINLLVSCATFIVVAAIFDRVFDRGGILLSKKIFPGNTDPSPNPARVTAHVS